MRRWRASPRTGSSVDPRFPGKISCKSVVLRHEIGMPGFLARILTRHFGNFGPAVITGRARFVHKDIPNFFARIETYSGDNPARKICGYFWGLIPNSVRFRKDAMAALRHGWRGPGFDAAIMYVGATRNGGFAIVRGSRCAASWLSTGSGG